MTQLTNNHWAVEVPSMAFGIMINNYGDESELMYMLSMEDIADEPNHEETLITKKLPPGTWQFLFTTKEAMEEQAEQLVGWYKKEHMYLDAYDDGRFPFKNHRESLQSLLRSKGLDPDKNYAIIKQNDNVTE